MFFLSPSSSLAAKALCRRTVRSAKMLAICASLLDDQHKRREAVRIDPGRYTTDNIAITVEDLHLSRRTGYCCDPCIASKAGQILIEALEKIEMCRFGCHGGSLLCVGRPEVRIDAGPSA